MKKILTFSTILGKYFRRPLSYFGYYLKEEPSIDLDLDLVLILKVLRTARDQTLISSNRNKHQDIHRNNLHSAAVCFAILLSCSGLQREEVDTIPATNRRHWTTPHRGSPLGGLNSLGTQNKNVWFTHNTQ